ncbi:MAG: hypothetical protein D3910_22335 [Candidatus Electrothrix sp. ATG2]|nr:hypothetical protein [Candidatus Electrothrix sp. ATG2]
MSDLTNKSDMLDGEYDPSQEQVQSLEREVARLQGELAQVRRKEGRFRTVASLVCQLYGSLQPQSTIQEIGSLFLHLLSEALKIGDVARFFRFILDIISIFKLAIF